MGHRLRTRRDDALNLADRERFVRAETRLAPVPFVPEIRIHQADEATALWQRTEVELAGTGLPPPFWAFAWAGGRGLARHLLDHPELVAGRRVVDFACGSAIVAIAAAMAGARSVSAIDIDPFAAAAASINAAANGVALDIETADAIGTCPETDILLAGDIFYDRAFALQVLPWLRRVAARSQVVIGDPGRRYRPQEATRLIAEYDVPVELALEDGVVKRVAILAIEQAGERPAAPPCDSASSP